MKRSAKDVWYGGSESEAGSEAGSELELGSDILDGEVVCLIYDICLVIAFSVDV